MTTGGRWSGISGEDELLSRLYQQLTEHQAARFGGEYDLAAGLDRYHAWLRDHATEGQVGQAGAVMALQVSAAGIGTVSSAPGVGEAVTASGSVGRTRNADSETPEARAGQDADRALTALYSMHYRSLVRLAAVLVGDVAIAEEIVQDSFVALHAAAWRRLANGDRALSYLRQSVVNRCRAVLGRHLVVDKLAQKIASDLPEAAREHLTLPERSALVLALRTLPSRQREVLVLRYYADLSEAQIASTMGISKSAVKTHIARAISSLQAELRRENI
jgi:RNA polymerase sigma-70 factor (sigma-E family)